MPLLCVQIAMKPQHVDAIKKVAKGTLGTVLEKLDERGMMAEICDAMDLNHLLDREATQVSGGELQRFAIAAVCLKKADIYVFDEPSNFLDVRQRLKAAEVIRSLLRHDKFGFIIIISSENDSLFGS